MTKTHRLLTAVTMLKGLHNFCTLPTTISTPHHAQEPCPYISPLYAPNGTSAALRDTCSPHTLGILTDMHTLTQAFLARTDHPRTEHPNPPISSINHTHPYTRLHHATPHPHPSQVHDYIHETILLTARIYTHALSHRLPFATSALSLHASTSTSTGGSLIHALLTALEHTDTTHCWGDMRGVFLWVCLIGGAAAWRTGEHESDSGQGVSPRLAWARKCFSMWAIRAVVSAGFEFAGGMLEGLRAAVRVGRELDGEDG